MKKRRNRSDSSAWMALPLYIFTIVFVVCPLIYMVALHVEDLNFGRTVLNSSGIKVLFQQDLSR